MIFSSILLAFSAMSAAYAGSSSQEDVSIKSQVKPDYTSCLQIGGNYRHMHLQPQKLHGQKFHPIKGNMGGVQGLYEYWAKSHFYAGTKLTWSQGPVHDADEYVFMYIDTQARVGAHVCIEALKAHWTFFSGLGYRRMHQDFRQENSFHFAYNEFYVPVGWNMDYEVNSWFHWDFNVTWMAQIFPSLWMHPLGGANWSLTKQFCNFLFEMPLDFSLNNKGSWHILVTPFYELWQSGRTTATTSWGLELPIPRNSYQFCGVNVNVGYCF